MVNIEPHLLISHLRDLASADAKITTDSRQVESGDIFFAYAVGHGNALRDGRDYITAALASGATFGTGSTNAILESLGIIPKTTPAK